MSSPKGMWASVVVVALAGFAFTADAPAHSMSEAKARAAAQRTANQIVKNSGGDYISATVRSCVKQFPHRVICRIGFHDAESQPTTTYACAERWTMLYRAHDSDEAGSPLIYYDVIATSLGGGHRC